MLWTNDSYDDNHLLMTMTFCRSFIDCSFRQNAVIYDMDIFFFVSSFLYDHLIVDDWVIEIFFSPLNKNLLRIFIDLIQKKSIFFYSVKIIILMNHYRWMKTIIINIMLFFIIFFYVHLLVWFFFRLMDAIHFMCEYVWEEYLLQIIMDFYFEFNW